MNASIYNPHVNDDPSFAFNGAARAEAFGGASRVESRVPVQVVPGRQAPTLEGEPGGAFTRGGTRIQHPGAYAKRGWSNVVYRTDTRVVTVGRDWTPASWRVAA